MKAVHLIYFLLAAGLITACSERPSVPGAVVRGHITVADSLDSSKNYAGIGVTIIKRDSANAQADTLFHEVTDESGSFSGRAEFPQRRRYRTLISRNGRNLGQLDVILADGDTLTITGELPDIEGTFSVQSREHDALSTYRRVERGFQRIAAFAQAGTLTGDSLITELGKWSDLFWEVYGTHKGTLASDLAASESVRLLQGWNDEKMMQRIRLVQDDDDLAGLAATYGKDYLVRSEGLDYTLAYLDSLRSMTKDRNMGMRISMERIKLLYDSARVEHAKTALAEFQKEYQNREAGAWAEAIQYDLNYLSPGDSIPAFLFTENGQTISRTSMLGTPYILEISALANSLYQEQYDRTVIIYSLYKTYGLQVVTLPLDASQVTIDAFFEERLKLWPVASAGAFNREELINRFNVQIIPTRFLVDEEGKIVRKYVGREYEDIIQGIQTLTTIEKPTS